MHNVRLSDDELATVLGALEAQGVSVPPQLASLASQTANSSTISMPLRNPRPRRLVALRSRSVPLATDYESFHNLRDINFSPASPLPNDTVLSSQLSHHEHQAALPPPILEPIPNVIRPTTPSQTQSASNAKMPLFLSSPESSPRPDNLRDMSPLTTPPSSPSPLTTPPTSPSPPSDSPLNRSLSVTALRKRKAYNGGDESEVSEEEDAEAEIPKGARARRLRGGAGGGGGSSGAQAVNFPPYPPCPRRGDRKHKKVCLEKVGEMPCQDPTCSQCQQEPPWTESTASAPLSHTAASLLSNLLHIYTRSSRLALDEVLDGRVECHADPNGFDTANVLKRLKAHEKRLKVEELEYMVALVQLALNVDAERAYAAATNGPHVSLASLQTKYSDVKVSRTSFSNWLQWGQHLLMLCAGGSLFMLPIVAVLGLRIQFTQKCEPYDVYCLATALREVIREDGKWLPQVRRLMVPVYFLKNQSGYIQGLKLRYEKTTGKGVFVSREAQLFGFGDMAVADAIFDSVQTNMNFLPKRSLEWDFTKPPPLWNPVPDPAGVKLPRVVVIKSPVSLRKPDGNKLKCPVNKVNRDSWTEKEREVAETAEKALSIEDLRERIQNKATRYTEVSTQFLNDEALFIKDVNDRLLALLFKIPEAFRKTLIAAVDHINSVLQGEFVDDDSRKQGFQYCSFHFSCRYALLSQCSLDKDKGHDAPKDIHPNKLRRTGVGRVNLKDRAPHRSEDITKHPEEYKVLAEAFTDFFEYLRIALEAYLPEETQELSFFIDELPLQSSSPCYPFGGFVINVCACTWGHRDQKDKRMCVVAPFGGPYTGGKLCLYEGKVVFDLEMGDGRRGTLVLHSDGVGGDSWLKDSHGWASWMINHKRNAEVVRTNLVA
ncbi:hypothetical protein R3P38DRAFT_2783848 [Favolaschia claudopus]|uniref:Uncharacterized protein n=1 Tax=Favolaschia claudopus TaxID=2862362 RepID=A0AAW0B154_9AGAR